jgi:hypothetical protein
MLVMRFGKIAMAMLMAGSATIVALNQYRAPT